jgi:hypothetical protein
MEHQPPPHLRMDIKGMVKAFQGRAGEEGGYDGVEIKRELAGDERR